MTLLSAVDDQLALLHVQGYGSWARAVFNVDLVDAPRRVLEGYLASVVPSGDVWSYGSVLLVAVLEDDPDGLEVDGLDFDFELDLTEFRLVIYVDLVCLRIVGGMLARFGSTSRDEAR
jgi:hypothetical protein